MQILEKVHDRAVLPLNEAFAKLTARELGQDLLERGDDLVHVGTLGWVVLHHTCDQRLQKRDIGIDLASIMWVSASSEPQANGTTYIKEVLPNKITHVVYIGVERIPRRTPVVLELRDRLVSAKYGNLKWIRLLRTVAP